MEVTCWLGDWSGASLEPGERRRGERGCVRTVSDGEGGADGRASPVASTGAGRRVRRTLCRGGRGEGRESPGRCWWAARWAVRLTESLGCGTCGVRSARRGGRIVVPPPVARLRLRAVGKGGGDESATFRIVVWRGALDGETGNMCACNGGARIAATPPPLWHGEAVMVDASSLEVPVTPSPCAEGLTTGRRGSLLCTGGGSASIVD
jgi:hypothetical protein